LLVLKAVLTLIETVRGLLGVRPRRLTARRPSRYALAVERHSKRPLTIASDSSALARGFRYAVLHPGVLKTPWVGPATRADRDEGTTTTGRTDRIQPSI